VSAVAARRPRKMPEPPARPLGTRIGRATTAPAPRQLRAKLGAGEAPGITSSVQHRGTKTLLVAWNALRARRHAGGVAHGFVAELGRWRGLESSTSAGSSTRRGSFSPRCPRGDFLAFRSSGGSARRSGRGSRYTTKRRTPRPWRRSIVEAALVASASQPCADWPSSPFPWPNPFVGKIASRSRCEHRCDDALSCTTITIYFTLPSSSPSLPLPPSSSHFLSHSPLNFPLLPHLLYPSVPLQLHPRSYIPSRFISLLIPYSPILHPPFNLHPQINPLFITIFIH
jgi:hypothetical protein